MADDGKPEGRSRDDETTTPPSDKGDAQPLPKVEHTTRRLLRVPRSAWWVLAAAGVLLLVFGLLRPQFFTRPPAGAPYQVPPERHFAKTFGALGHADGVWLTSDNPSATFNVTLPVDVGRSKDRIRLAGTAQIAEDSTVFLQVLMDGQQVFERELPSGNRVLDQVVEIPPAIAADGELRVTTRFRGILSHPRCSPEQAAGAIINLNQHSVIEAELAQPLHTVRDVAAALDHHVTVLVADAAPEWFATATALGVALIRAGHEVQYVSEIAEDAGPSVIMLGPPESLADKTGWTPAGNGQDEIIRVGTVGATPRLAVVTPEPELASRFLTTPVLVTADGVADLSEAIGTTRLDGDQVALEALGTDMSEITLTENRSWRADYSLADMPGGRIPRALRVEMRLPATPPDLSWILTTNLNGQMVDSRRLTAEPAVVPLPQQAHLMDNQLTMTVQRDRDLGGCDVRVTPYPMQLLPGSSLQLGDDPGAGFTALARPLTGDAEVRVVPGADPVVLLNAIVGVVAEFSPWGRFPDIRPDPGTPLDRPFILVGGPLRSSLLQFEDSGLIAGTGPVLDLTPFQDGLVVQCAGGLPGVVVSVIGDPGRPVLGSFGRECAQVITPAGSFAVVGGGEVLVATPVRKASG
ncbi:hypothetical protein BST23_00095 [Mycolicibacterium elephantis]|uniref:Uncharacterized protein n=1 Tax=Mycolicibacterium elephantis TaxID=81858 RepID=A0A1X0DBF9_9MYCO|nr:hypothetical protein [Mycolicibacterium elephantis]ORA69110.1 hypothetical protein BST23_00095 [Mycolicibacterium elephantis]